MIAVDTNVIARYLVRDDPAQAAAADRILDARSAADPAFVARIVLVELVWVLRRAYKYDRGSVGDVVEPFVDADDVAATFGVSRAWVHRLAQRQRETGSIAPRKPTKFRSRVLAGQEERLKALVNATPDATLAELRDALPTTAALSTLWLELDRLGLTVKKNRTRRRTAAP